MEIGEIEMTIPVSRIADALLEGSIAGSFSRAGYETRSRLEHWTPLTNYDMTAKTVVVTGPTSGLGKELAFILRRANANLVLVARNQEKLDALGKELSSVAGNGAITKVVADMGNLASVRTACNEVISTISAIDVMVHNAGALSKIFSQTDDGVESTVASHVVGPFLMTTMLLPLLRKAHGRVVTVSSGGMYAAPLPHLRQGGSLEKVGQIHRVYRKRSRHFVRSPKRCCELLRKERTPSRGWQWSHNYPLTVVLSGATDPLVRYTVCLQPNDQTLNLHEMPCGRGVLMRRGCQRRRDNPRAARVLSISRSASCVARW